MGRKQKAAAAATPIDTSRGSSAYALAIQHRAVIEPRLPAGTIAELAADLGTLGKDPTPPTAPSPPPESPPSLTIALTAAANLVSAIHDALRAGKAKPTIRKAYGVSKSPPQKEPKALLDAAEKIIAQASGSPDEALSLGILPADVKALQKAVADLEAAVTVAQAHGGKTTPTAKDKHAAALRMNAATGRIAAAGLLAFAQDATTRAEFAALAPPKKA